MTFVPTYICFMAYSIIYSKYIFHVKIKLFSAAKSDQDPDPHGSGLVLLQDPDPPWIRISIAPWIRIRIEIKSGIRIRIETDADPKH
jgi:hypothetical protein